MSSNELDSVLDVRFFHFTGVALIVATLLAGAMMLTLAIGESRAIYLAQEAHTQVPVQLAAIPSPTE
jgi:hypothetical protein